ncbi:hypothetical protein D5086_002942 [Populus alba]|uniref:Uncharacterized protein n=1 Tax=Populus alba TaxID=43335 RepID=A0ACC4D4S8_POPAL
MAFSSSCRRFISKSSLSSIKSAIRSSNVPKSPSMPTRSATALPSSKPPTSPQFSFSRAPCELGCVLSLLPLHSAVAASRMTSCLSTTSRSCRALSQECAFSQVVCYLIPVFVVFISLELGLSVPRVPSCRRSACKMKFLRTFWNSPIGPRTTHFWGPVFNWSLPIAANSKQQGSYMVLISKPSDHVIQ